MRIWVDADACPKAVKEIIFRTAIRTATVTILVANQLIETPRSPFIQKLVVTAGFDVADNRIVQDLVAGDLVITADIPLADAVIDKGGAALNPRGELYSASNIKQRLSIRNFSEGLRGSGVRTGGPAKQNPQDVKAFADALDRFMSARRS